MRPFITIEGIEGAGKSTQAARLADALRRAGREVVLTREPGGTELGRTLRRLLLDEPVLEPMAETELLLYLADRSEHVGRLIRPALEKGAVVVADRFSDSTVAYQAYGRGLPEEDVRRLDRFARAGLLPALTFVLDVPAEVGLARAQAAGPADRLEREPLEFHERVRSGFRAIAAAEPERVVLLDGTREMDVLGRMIAERTQALLSGRAEA